MGEDELILYQAAQLGKSSSEMIRTIEPTPRRTYSAVALKLFSSISTWSRPPHRRMSTSPGRFERSPHCGEGARTWTSMRSSATTAIRDGGLGWLSEEYVQDGDRESCRAGKGKDADPG